MEGKNHLTYKISFAYFVFIIIFSAETQAQTGVLQGRIVDAVTSEPLIGASITIEGLKLGAQSDENGAYIIKEIPQGTYTLKAAYVGYRPLIKNQVLIERGVTQLNFELSEDSKETETVEIVGSAFSKTSQNMISVRSLGVEQIRSNPGGNFDISKVVQSLPGVSGSAGFRNDIIVRGGAPNENVFYLDGVEIPNLNHFSTQGSGGGPVGIINSVFIEKVNFQSSAFGAKYDNTLSSVLDFDMTSGNTERFQTTLQISGTEAGLTFDTPIGKKVTALVSVRRSYLQFLFKAIGLPFLPDYWDGQAKVQWRLNPKTTLTYIGIGAIDRFSFNAPDKVSLENKYILDGLPVFEQDSYTQGATLKRLTKSGFFTVALSRNELNNRSFKHIENDVNKAFLYDFRSKEAENKLRVNFVNKIGSWEIGYGGVVQYATFTNSTYNLLPDLFPPAGPDTLRVKSDIGFFRYGAYGTAARAFFNNRLRATFGLRFDLNSFTEKGNNPLETLSPRLALSYAVTEKIAINASVGTYSKLPPYTILGFQTEGVDNKSARYIQATHLVLGGEYRVSDSWIVTLEGFYKIYDRYPVSVRDSVSLANLGGNFGVLGNEKIESVGKGRAYGLELFTQKMLSKRLYGTASYTLYYSEFTGFDVTKYIRSSWDNRHLASLTGGYLIGKKKTWEIAAKWRFLGPAPYTPFNESASIQNYIVRGEGVLDYSRINTLQSKSFSQIDLRIDKKWFFKKWSLNLFLDIQNLLSTKNPGTPNFTLKRDPATEQFVVPYVAQIVGLESGNLIPSLGVRVKF